MTLIMISKELHCGDKKLNLTIYSYSLHYSVMRKGPEK